MSYLRLGDSQCKLIKINLRSSEEKEMCLALTEVAFPNPIDHKNPFFSEHLLITCESSVPGNRSWKIVFLHDFLGCFFSPHFWDDRWVVIVIGG